MNDGMIALELLDDRLVGEEPERAAFFLLTILFPDLNLSNPVKWAHVDFTHGTLLSSGRKVQIPERILELLELARERRRDESKMAHVFNGAHGYQSKAEYVETMRSGFRAYKQSAVA